MSMRHVTLEAMTLEQRLVKIIERGDAAKVALERLRQIDAAIRLRDEQRATSDSTELSTANQHGRS